MRGRARRPPPRRGPHRVRGARPRADVPQHPRASIPLPGEMSHVEEELHKVAGSTVGEVMDDGPAHGRRPTTRSRTSRRRCTSARSRTSRSSTRDGMLVGIVARGDIVRFIARTDVTAHRPVWAEVDLGRDRGERPGAADAAAPRRAARGRQGRRLRPRRGPGRPRRARRRRVGARRRARRGGCRSCATPASTRPSSCCRSPCRTRPRPSSRAG